MYVYLTSNGTSTFMSITSEPAGCYIAPGWKLYMALETHLDVCTSILYKWKTESHSLISSIRRGFELSKMYGAVVHVSSIPVGELKKLSTYSMSVARVKNVPADFWVNL